MQFYAHSAKSQQQSPRGTLSCKVKSPQHREAPTITQIPVSKHTSRGEAAVLKCKPVSAK